MKYKDEEMKNHVCEVLKDFSFKILALKTDDILLNNIKVILNYVLCSNQHISNVLTDIMKNEMGNERFYEEWGAIFPAFFDNYDKNFISKWMDYIDEEIESIEPVTELNKINETDFYDALFSLDKFTLLDLTIPWGAIVSYFKSDPEKYSEELSLSEYGYYLGKLINLRIVDLRKKHKDSEWSEPNWLILRSRVNRYLPDVKEGMKKKGLL